MGPLSRVPGIRAIPTPPPALPGGGDFPVDLVIATAAPPEQLAPIAQQLVQKAFASGLFIFADADGFVTSPPNPPIGNVTWKMLAVSGNARRNSPDRGRDVRRPRAERPRLRSHGVQMVNVSA